MWGRIIRQGVQICVIGAGLHLSVAQAEVSAAGMPVVDLSVGMYRIKAELADTDASRQLGLMNREEMPQNHGMVFAFEKSGAYCMWMRNTLIPLSVAFMDEEGRILNIENMKPQTENNHCAVKPAFFALEMNEGWFSERGIEPGQVIRGVEHLFGKR